jgi:hypothetical protein
MAAGKVQWFSRQVYGHSLRYPANDTAIKFARLINCKSFSFSELATIRQLGFEVEQVVDPSSVEAPA